MAPIWKAFSIVNTTNYVGLFEYANTVTGSVFMIFAMFGVWFISFMAMRRWGSDVSLLVSSFLTGTICILLRGSGLVGDWMAILFMVMTMVAGIMLYRGDK